LDAQARLVLAAAVEIAVQPRHLLALPPRAVTQALDVVVAVALDVRDAERPDRRQVLLKREDRHGRQVFGGHEERGLRLVPRLPALDQRAVQEGLDDALAILGADAPVPEPGGRLERAQFAVALVDDDRDPQGPQRPGRGWVERDRAV